MKALPKLRPGFHVRQSPKSLSWNVYFKRSKVAGGFIGEYDAYEFADEHDENCKRLVPLEPLAMTKFDWKEK
jgi:hypothetical protein